ncbi:hypothetical protein PsYK624_026530 [Phanerochaete sordida]|uniref:Fungal-type protein kinase domain-containing protein n=1 Tax=Phanerochaete sordida TaxID=48140 RepID=A0A9P3G1K5_9APHY|nr:hypothetical protein PsYK624_026530 [Phanerochaete sordida]
MAVDANTKKAGESPLKSLSWSETTVAQVDDRCIQISVAEFIKLIDGEDLTDKQASSLKTFRGIDTKKLPDNSESKKYRPLCDILNKVEELAGSDYRWMVVANHGESAEVDHRPDLARYPININAAKQAYMRDMDKDDANIARCAWAWMNCYIEVKNAESKSPFFFGRNLDKKGLQKFLRQGETGKQARGQFIKYLTEASLRQQRTHYFSIYISDMAARVFRWDRVGCIASEPIDLKKHPKVFLNILYRLATTADQGGVDQTVMLATEDEVAPLEAYDPAGNKSLQDYRDFMLEDLASYPIYKVTCPAVSLDGTAPGPDRTYLIGRCSFGHYAPVGRCTRGYPAFDVAARRLVWLKDQWRCAARPHTELEAYVRLHQHGVKYIATPVAGGDVAAQRTLAQDYMTHLSGEWRPSERVHTRLVTKEVGRLLETYKDSVELLRICGHAFWAHRLAWEKANILHRDVSIGNIMIDCETGNGFLNDWDLCKYREDMEDKRAASEPSGISGTWAFKSAMALRYPRKPPELADDLESFVHVITFFACRFHDHDLSSEPENDTEEANILANANNQELMGLISLFFYHQKRVGNGFYRGGALKYQMILLGSPPINFKALKSGMRSPLETFLSKAYKLLQEHYWSLDESELEEYAVRGGDCAAPDEIDVDLPAPPEAPQAPVVPGPAIGEDDAFVEMWAEYAAEAKPKDAAYWRGAAQTKATCPFADPQPVLRDHRELAMVFLSFLKDADGRNRVLDAYAGDKRFDQFLSRKMILYLQCRGPSGRCRAVSEQSTAKRKRELEDAGDDDDDDDATPPKKPAPPRTDGPRTRARSRAREAAAQAEEPAPQGTSTTRRAARAAAPAPKPTSTSKTTKRRPAKTARAADKPAKTAPKASASRRAQAARRPASPRRAVAVKAEVTRKAPAPRSKAKAAPPAEPTRRSQRLACKS